MNSAEAIEKLEKMLKNKRMDWDSKCALQVALEALKGNPCAVCVYSPPSAGDGRPCTYCPATGRVIE